MANQLEQEQARILIDIRNSGRPQRRIVGNTLTITQGNQTISLAMFGNNVQSERVALFK